MATSTNFAQISDCHLYADWQALHHGAHVYENLCVILTAIKVQGTAEFIIFTGDLTQDHSEQSYQNFVTAIKQNNIEIPVYFLAGNHDDELLLSQILIGKPFNSRKIVETQLWDIHLINSKSESLAGFVDCYLLNDLIGTQFNVSNKSCLTDKADSIDKLDSEGKQGKYQFLMMHHHPIDVGYFIDRHGLINKADFWKCLGDSPQVKAIACGHVHNAISLFPSESGYDIPLFTCPATSIQFDQKAETVVNANKGAGYRMFSLSDSGEIKTQAHFVSNQ